MYLGVFYGFMGKRVALVALVTLHLEAHRKARQTGVQIHGIVWHTMREYTGSVEELDEGPVLFLYAHTRRWKPWQY